MSRHLRLLVATCHPGPTLLVTGLAGALAAGHRLPVHRAALVTATVLAGQLTIGWANDLLDADRDARAGRTDKPLALDPGGRREVAAALGGTTAACLVLSRCCGRRAGLVHVVLVVGSGWAYDAGLKGSTLSILPYALAFGGLPHVVALADPHRPRPAARWQTVAGASIGCAAHLLDVLPDLADDADTGVRGYPHRWSERGLRAQAALALLAAQGAVLAGTLPSRRGTAALLGAAVPLALGVTRGPQRLGFWCAGALALADVALWTRAAPAPGEGPGPGRQHRLSGRRPPRRAGRRR